MPARRCCCAPLPRRRATGAGLDLGCGAGPIAVTLAGRAPGARVWAVDVNERARALCAANASANGRTNIVVAAPDDVPADVRFDVIWSNPPIRIGKAALHELLAAWLDRLTPSGRAVLVVQKHLGADSLQRWLIEHGWPTVRLASAKGYRLLEVHASTRRAHPRDPSACCGEGPRHDPRSAGNTRVRRGVGRRRHGRGSPSGGGRR